MTQPGQVWYMWSKRFEATGRLASKAGLNGPKRRTAVIGKVEASLRKLASLSKDLNEASDELSRQIAGLETALNGYKLGVWAWVKNPIIKKAELSEPDEKGNCYFIQYTHHLFYGKHKGKWGLLVNDGWEWEDEERHVTFLRNAPREVRLSAMDRIPDLLDDLVEKVAAVTKEASEKAAQAKELATALRPSLSEKMEQAQKGKG